jgi:hypothetical protein
MFPPYEVFQSRADALREQIASACRRAGRDPATVELLAVTKTHSVEAVNYAARYGLRAVGENRVQETVEKQLGCTAKIQWELIGHLQSNKAKLAATHFDRVQSVDSEKLITQLDNAAGALGKTLPILLQINAGRDPAKFGAEIEDAPRLLAAALDKAHLRIDGLMTIAPLSDDPAVAERTFAALREMRDTLSTRFGLPLRELSMGMSGDLEAAVLAGSTQVRVGSALYGSR